MVPGDQRALPADSHRPRGHQAGPAQQQGDDSPDACGQEEPRVPQSRERTGEADQGQALHGVLRENAGERERRVLGDRARRH